MLVAVARRALGSPDPQALPIAGIGTGSPSLLVRATSYQMRGRRLYAVRRSWRAIWRCRPAYARYCIMSAWV